MKKETVKAEIVEINGKPYVQFTNSQATTELKTVLNNITVGLNRDFIESLTAQEKKGCTFFKYKIYDEEGNFSNYFELSVPNKFRYMTRGIKEISKVQQTIKTENENRIIAGILAGAFVLSMIGGTIKIMINAKANEKANENPKPAISDTERFEAEKEYYEELRQKALNGDEKAKVEYSVYLAEQELKEQNKQEEQERGFHK